jgi:hypothetical protein
MFRVPRVAVAFVFVSLLGGCAEEWVKPGATPRDFEAAEADCEARAYARFPERTRRELVRDEYYRPDETRCDSSGRNCRTTRGQYVPPEYRTVDLNGNGRNADVRSCLFSRGWTPKK